MKTLLTPLSLLLLILVMAISACSRRTNTPCSTVLYEKYSHQLEANRPINYPVSANNEKIVSSETNAMPAEEKSVQATNTIKEVKKNAVTAQPKNVLSVEKETKPAKTTLANKMLMKKLEKSFRKQNTMAPQEATGGLKTGIILGAVGLLLLITAGFFGPASPIIYVSGAVLFVVGVVLILINVL